MKKFLLMTAAIAATSGLFAKKVKFQVDMTGKTISPNGVYVAGNFQKAAGASSDWKPSATKLSNGGSGNIYSVIVDIPAMAVYEFKFINDSVWGPGEESIPAISKRESAANGGSNGNRWAYIDSLKNDTSVLPAILFGGSAPANKIALRFAVDLQKETSVSSNGVYIAGNFQGSNGASGDWKPNETRMANLFGSNKVYEYIAYVGNTDGVEWKYLNGNAWGPAEEAIPSGCQKGGGNSNRFFQGASTSTALAKICFSSCTACPAAPLPTYSYTFKVDMNGSDCDGGFDSVTVAGRGAKLTGFGAGLKMTQVGTTGVYELTVNNLDSGELEFKYRLHKNGSTKYEEGGGNRIVPLSKNDVANLTCFSSRVVGNCPSKPAPSKLTFIADFTGAGAPAPASKIFIIGDFTKIPFQGGAIELIQLVGKPGVYSTTVDSICPGKISFKFVNGDVANTANEEDFKDTTQRSCLEANGVSGFNRTFVRTVATPVVISYQFNTCKVGFVPGTSINEVLANNVKLYPNPTNDYTVLAFNNNAASHNVAILDLAGKVVRTYNNYELSTLKIERNELKAGIYFVNITNSNNQTATVKLMIQE
ncbi:MAG: T9SS type A sorting domain-containing protein [Candidatus Methylacidiphilales bacterium]